MELVECFPNKLGKLLCANSCETNDKIICHTNQCTIPEEVVLFFEKVSFDKSICLKGGINITFLYRFSKLEEIALD